MSLYEYNSVLGAIFADFCSLFPKSSQTFLQSIIYAILLTSFKL